MLEKLNALSRSHDWEGRARAARLVARLDPAESEALILRLLMDEHDTAVTDAMVEALLEARGEAGVPLILRALRQADDDSGQHLLMGLLAGQERGFELGAAIVAVLLTTTDREELAGALEAIAWLAPAGYIPSSAAALARLRTLETGADDALRSLVWDALEGLAANPVDDPDRRLV